MKHVLVATDLSDSARDAVDRAFRVAEESAAPLALIHVINQSALDTLRGWLGQPAQAVEEHILADARAELARLAAALGEGRDVAVELHLATGAALPAILAHAEAVDASLLVVGARGESVLRPLILGTTSERLLRKTERPVLIVRQPARAPYRRVLVPVDFSPWTHESVRLARAIAPHARLIVFNGFAVPFEAKLRFAGITDAQLRDYITTAEDDARRRLRQAVADAGLAGGDVHIEASHGDAVPGILEQQAKHGADLIVLGKHGKGFFEELLLGSVTKHVLAEAECDIAIATLKDDGSPS